MQLAGNRSFYLMANWKSTACKWRYNDFYCKRTVVGISTSVRYSIAEEKILVNDMVKY